MIDTSMVGRHGVATLGESKLVGKVEAVYPGGWFDLLIDEMDYRVRLGPKWSFVPDAPELPTEPGYYLDEDGNAWRRLDALGNWHSPWGDQVTSQEAAQYAPFTRLRPESEVAAEVINWIADQRAPFGPWTVNDAFEHFGIEVSA